MYDRSSSNGREDRVNVEFIKDPRQFTRATDQRYPVETFDYAHGLESPATLM